MLLGKLPGAVTQCGGWLHSLHLSVWLPSMSPGACSQPEPQCFNKAGTVGWQAGRWAALLQAGFPAGHRWTDRQALARGEGQVGRGAGPSPWWTSHGLAEQAASGRKDQVQPHTKLRGDGCHLRLALHLSHTLPHGYQSLHSGPPVCTCRG